MDIYTTRVHTHRCSASQFLELNRKKTPCPLCSSFGSICHRCERRGEERRGEERRGDEERRGEEGGEERRGEEGDEERREEERRGEERRGGEMRRGEESRPVVHPPHSSLLLSSTRTGSALFHARANTPNALYIHTSPYKQIRKY